MRLPRAGVTALLALAPSAAAAADGTLNGAALSPVWMLPFAGILLSIALVPLTAPAFWHHHFGKTAAFWALVFLVPFAARFGPALALREVAHTLLAEYLPFIILLLALYTVAGGIHIRSHLHGTPALNTGILAAGTVLASLMGTTGAAMLLIRPLLRANEHRRHKAHAVIFFIFLVANIGGALTPLGDPPLFLGFLKGVDFFWTTKAMFWPTLTAAVVLLALFYVIDRWYFTRRDEGLPGPVDTAPDRITIEGKVNFLLLLAILGCVLASGMWKPDIEITIYGTTRQLPGLLRDAALLGIAWASWRLTPRQVRRAHHFEWGPIVEVAKLFAAIFLTIIPAIAILRAGNEGVMAPLVAVVSNPSGQPSDPLYFWVTGALSSFLDNAPTYLVFFNLAGADPETLMGPLGTTLAAISAGAVFMGANTYIGNAPNFMVKSIAEARGVRMPGFLGYMAWSGIILLPLFALLSVLFF
ncbi:MAG TPA: sodium:proton antiporter [Casimicrobiaceae bacterium]|nr:sodium:proton antiporter [Casimicrobiaceae bacterium]